MAKKKQLPKTEQNLLYIPLWLRCLLALKDNDTISIVQHKLKGCCYRQLTVIIRQMEGRKLLELKKVGRCIQIKLTSKGETIQGLAYNWAVQFEK